TMSALGNTQPIHPALRGFVEGCEGILQPCWYGIIPGVTTFETAVNRIKTMNYKWDYDVEYPRYDWVCSNYRGEFELTLCHYTTTSQTEAAPLHNLFIAFPTTTFVSIGDVMMIWGDPLGYGSTNYNGMLELFFANNIYVANNLYIGNGVYA